MLASLQLQELAAGWIARETNDYQEIKPNKT